MWRCGEDLGGVGRDEIIIKIYCMKKKLFPIKIIEEKRKYPKNICNIPDILFGYMNFFPVSLSNLHF